MKYKYGNYSDEQVENYKKKLHKKMFWLILYKDPQTKSEYPDVDFDRYFKSLMKEINGLNDLFGRPPEIIEIMALLQAAYTETQRDIFSYSAYRKFVLDAHALVDQINNKEA